ncbi:MAG: CSLREA domain-containing protein [Planctomycetota bacterium]
MSSTTRRRQSGRANRDFRRLSFEPLQERAMLTFVVDSLADSIDGDYSSGNLTLREAVLLANTQAGEDTITFDPQLSASTILLEAGNLTVTDSLAIDGSGLESGVTLNAQYLSRVLDFPAETGNLTLSHLTIQNGQTTDDSDSESPNGGGAIRFLSEGSLKIHHSTISGNRTTGGGAHGGGIFFLGNLLLENSIVSGNQASGAGSRGGGLANGSSAERTIEVVDSRISDNTTTSSGGGAYFRGQGQRDFVRSTVSGNHSGGDGGGIYAFDQLRLVDSRVLMNYTTGDHSSGGGIFSNQGIHLIGSEISRNWTEGAASRGGGVYLFPANRPTSSIYQSTISRNHTEGVSSEGGGIYFAGQLTATNSTISGNFTEGQHSSGGGVFHGGIHAEGSLLELNNSTLSGNQATGRRSSGGGLFSLTGSVAISASTVTGNIASQRGGGLFTYHGVDLSLTNSIVAGNRGHYYRNIEGPDLFRMEGNYAVTHTLLGNNFGSGFEESQSADENGNLIGSDSSPIDAMLGPLQNNGGATQTHSLLSGSPAIDSGLSDGRDFDQRGLPFRRLYDDPLTDGTGADMGAQERQSHSESLFNVNTTQDELDFSNSTVSLREAVEIANGNPGLDTISFDPAVFDNDAPIVLELGEIEITDSLEIDGSTSASAIAVDGQHASRVFNFSGETGDLNIRALSIRNGFHDVDEARRNGAEFGNDGGAGIQFASSGQLTLSQTRISENHAYTTNGLVQGGGIHIEQGNLRIEDSHIAANRVTSRNASGGGIFMGYGQLTVVNSLISGNHAYSPGSVARGGGISIVSGFADIYDSHFEENLTTADSISAANRSLTAYGGGAIYTRRARILIEGSTLNNNSSFIGGAITASNADIIVNDSTISNNRSLTSGGGIATIFSQ